MHHAGDVGDGGQAVAAQLLKPVSLAVTPQGDLLVADFEASRIRLVTMSNGTISTIVNAAGGAGIPNNGQLAAEPKITGPMALTMDATGAFYFADVGFKSYWKVAPDAERDGALTLYQLAGTGEEGFSGDGYAPLAKIGYVHSSAITPNGTIFLAQPAMTLTTPRSYIRKMVNTRFDSCPIATGRLAAKSMRVKASSVFEARVWPWPGALPKVVLPPGHSAKYDQLLQG